MNVLLVGSGGREHAIAWRVAQSPRLSKLWIAPGNPGTARFGENVDVKATDLDGIVALAQRIHADLVIVGPEDPLAAGLVDRLAAADIPAFGPSGAAAQLEASKAFAKQIMRGAGIATSGRRSSWAEFCRPRLRSCSCCRCWRSSCISASRHFERESQGTRTSPLSATAETVSTGGVNRPRMPGARTRWVSRMIASRPRSLRTSRSASSRLEAWYCFTRITTSPSAHFEV